MAQRALDDFMTQALIWAAGVQASISNDEADEAGGPSPVEQAETFILGSVPVNAVQMIVQLEIICHDLDEGRRTDGLDVQAVRNIQRTLSEGQSLDPGGDLARFASLRRESWGVGGTCSEPSAPRLRLA